MIMKVSTKKQLKQFVYYVKDLYKDDPYYVYPIFYLQYKELQKLVLDKKTYTALLYVESGQVQGRLLYTKDYSKKQQKDIMYFSHFDQINDTTITKELFNYMEEDMRKEKVTYSEGTFTPYDPDTRRGVMIKGYHSHPSIFTSYNYDYYPSLLESVGYGKAIDTVLLNAMVNDRSKKKLNSFSKFFLRNNEVSVDSINFKNLERDLKDVKTILDIATNEVIYQDAPSYELIASAAENMRSFIHPDLVKIAREKDGTPIGFCLVLPDFNEVLKQTNGRIRPLKMRRLKKHIKRARGMMQYVVPKYQSTGLIAHMFKCVFDEFEKHGFTEFEAGTMMEDNLKPIKLFEKFGGEIIKVYRLYGKELTK